MELTNVSLEDETYKIRSRVSGAAEFIFFIHSLRRTVRPALAASSELARLEELARHILDHLVERSDDPAVTITERDGLVQILGTYSNMAIRSALQTVFDQADHWDLYAHPEHGTFIYAEISILPRELQTYRYGAICIQIKGETECGDAWAIIQNRALVCDGLGHGPAAADASNRAVEIFLKHDQAMPINELVEQLHLSLAGTRGCALAIAEIEPIQLRVRFCGVGNIAAMILSDKTQGLVSKNGTAGYKMGKAQTFEYSWDPAALLIMTSDGIYTRVDLSGYAGLQARHPAIISAVIFRSFRKPNDDATVLVMSQGLDIPRRSKPALC